MKRILNIMTLSMITVLMTACVPTPTPQIGIGVGGLLGQEVQSAKTPTIKAPTVQTVVIDKEYGAKPLNYTTAIRSYFSSKIARAELSQYKYGKPKRAYKKKGFAYGGDIAWKGWLVETSIATPTRTGRLLTPKPYMVLFTGEQVVEHILGYSHKLITKIDK